MNRCLWRSLAAGLLAALLAPAQASAEVGQVVAAWGEVQLDGVGSAPGPAAPGGLLPLGSRLRTGSTGRAKIVFGEHTVVDVAPDSEIVVQAPADGRDASRGGATVEVLAGKVRTRHDRSARRSGPAYQVETATAIVVRGTDFVVQHDLDKASTRVVCVRDTAEVLGRLALVGGSVRLGSRQSTVVRRGSYPVAPVEIELDAYREMLQGFTIIGTGSDDGLAQRHPAITGRLLSPRDLPGTPADVVGIPSAGLVLEAPADFLADELSEDFRVNDEPLLEYERQQPGLPLPASKGGVIVEF